MKSKQWIKAIATLGASISLVGATLLGSFAMAESNSYPAPFVKDGQFNGMIVVGSDAAAEDVVGAIDIGTALQYAMRQQVSLGVSIDPTVNAGKKIEKTGDKFNYGDSAYDIISTLDNEDLPQILADGRYQDEEGENTNKVDYTQTLKFSDDTNTLKRVRDKSNSNGDNKATDDYLFISDNIPAYTYTLEFDSPVVFDSAADLEDTTIRLQGQDYTITSASVQSGKLEKLELLSGETVVWLQQGKELTRYVAGAEHSIMVSDVSESEDMCGVVVDGDTVWVKVGQVKTINGVEVGVSDAVAVHAQLQDVDVCKINVGATEIILKDGSEVKVNNVDVEGSEVTIDQSILNEVSYFSISTAPEDDVYLAAGNTWSDPALGKFGIRFAGMSAKTELLSAETSSEEASFIFQNNDDDTVELPLIAYGGAVYFGDGDNTDYAVTMSNGQMMALANGDSCTGNIDATDCEGIKFLAISSGKEARLMEIGNVDLNDKTVDIKDMTGSNSFNDKPFGEMNLRLVNAEITLSADNKTITFVNIQETTQIDTKYNAVIGLNMNPGIMIAEDDGNVISVDYVWDAVDEEIQLSTPAGFVSMDKIEAGSSIKTGYTLYGTVGTYDSDDKDSLDIAYPDSEAYGNVFVAPTDAFVTAAGEVSTVTINPIVGAAMLDSEVEDITGQNIIAIGGPCANSVSKILLNQGEDCTAGFTLGQAIIKTVANGNNVAMVVAGYSAADTRAATKILAEEGSALSGNVLIVDVASMTVSAAE